MRELTSIIDLLTNILLSVTRMAVAFYTVPFIHQSTLMPMVRNAVVLSFTIPVLPLIMSYRLPEHENVVFLLTLVAKEGFIGFLIGLLIGIIFWAAASAGSVIDTQQGESNGMLTDPLLKDQTSSMGSLLFQLVAIVFFVSGGFREMIGALIDSYHIWPVDRYFPHIDHRLADFTARQLVRCLNLAAIIAAPMVITALMADISLGMLNRFAPQMNIFMISLPVKSAIAALIMVFYVFFLVKFVQGNFMNSDAILQTIRQVIQ
jgi:type III secretion protein T